MTHSAPIKNDTLSDDLNEAFNQLEIETDKLEVVSWIMHCMADPMEQPPRASMGHMDVMHFIADVIQNKVADIDKIAADARIRIMEWERAAR